MIQTAVGIFSMSHCAVSAALHHGDELHPDLGGIPMQENMQTNKEPSRKVPGSNTTGAFLLLYVLYLSGCSPLPPQSRNMYAGVFAALNLPWVWIFVTTVLQWSGDSSTVDHTSRKWMVGQEERGENITYYWKCADSIFILGGCKQ